ncbi:hypothetical protein [Halorubrum sp. AJ67]|uniref:hypothetical protein n=1 Tax=Halorubrum sp. AJ67 TaxID=1173487 RepID=UPI0003DD0B33|nr:hypothetical protein [Halorubrum sp. AJ67]CDK38524.1 uncharacterized protein BN903_199 [Halorubrum sp. AJ67]
MDLTSLVPDSGPNYKLYYLIPASFIYLFYQLGREILLVPALIGLIGVISRHSTSESLYGPDGKKEANLSSQREIHRVGALVYRNKVPAKYSADSWLEMAQEGTFQSTYWAIVMGVIFVFQFSVSVLYIIAVYLLFTNLLVIDYIGGVLLFALVGLVVHGAIRLILPDISDIDDIPSIDQELRTVVEGFSHTLNGDDIVVTGAAYGAARGGIFEIAIEAECESDELKRRTINQIATAFCSVVNRSSYPVVRSDFRIEGKNGSAVYFCIDTKWCRKLSNGQISANEFLHHIGQTVSVREPNGEIVVYPINQD